MKRGRIFANPHPIAKSIIRPSVSDPMKITPDSRSLLQAAITSRDTARNFREQAGGILSKADLVLASAANEREKARAALAKAEHDQAGVIADAIRTGDKPDTYLAPAVKNAQTALAEIDSRHRMAQAARNRLADELSRASADVVEAEQAVTHAAEGVIIAEVAERCSLEAVDAAIKTLVDTELLVDGLTRTDLVGIKLNLPPKLSALLDRLRTVRHIITQFHGDRPMLAPPPEHQMMERFAAYRTALTQNPETKLDDVPTPNWTPPQPSSVNIIEREREAMRARIAAAG